MPGFQSKSQNATPVWLADDDGNPISASGGSSGGTDASPSVTRAQRAAGNETSVVMTAGIQRDILPAGNYNGVSILNYCTSPVYVQFATGRNPAADAPSSYIPAAVNGVPGQFEPPFTPTAGISGKSANAGNLTVLTW